MATPILDARDQKFVLHDMLKVDRLINNQKYSEFSSDMFDMILTEAQKFATEEIFPTLKEADKEGCKLENGQVYVPKVFQKCYKRFCESGWNNMDIPQEVGGQGLPRVIAVAVKEWFTHNFAFLGYPELTQGAAYIIEAYGTKEQKQKYLSKMVSGEWAGTMCLTEPSAGSDVGNLSTKAIRQPDGTFKIKGTKMFITGGDHDLTQNIIHPVLARIEGDPLGTKGISIFIIPKYIVNNDGSLGRRNDYEIGKIEEKLGIHGSSTCLMDFGDNNECYGELLGKEREGMKIMFMMMNGARIGVGLQGVASTSISYLHALEYAKERPQGSSLENYKNPEAPRVPIIQHPDVRRMLMLMKADSESVRALLYFTAYCIDMEETADNEKERDKWHGFLEILTPTCKAYATDIGFKAADLAMQVYGGAGYCMDYPIEQFMRDARISPIYEGTNGIQALDLVGRKLSMKGGVYFTNLLMEMSSKIAAYKEYPDFKDLVNDVQAAINTVSDIGFFFAKCASDLKFTIPLGNAYSFLTMMGRTLSAWFLLWQSAIAKDKLNLILKNEGIDPTDMSSPNEFLTNSKEASYYNGKTYCAKYFIKNVLPEVEASAKAIKSEDTSIMDIPEESFA